MHVIRLRGPYEFQPNSPTQDLATRVDLPLPQLSESLLGGVLIRRFGKPTGLESSDQVFLVVEAFPEETAIMLNGQLLSEMVAMRENASEGSFVLRQEIGNHLQSRNELRLELPKHDINRVPSNSEGWLQVRLEIVGSSNS